MKRAVIFFVVLILTVGIVFGISYKTGFINPPLNKSITKIHMVSLMGNKAVPDIVLAKVGDFVQFNAKDGKDHNLAQGDGNAVDKNHDHEERGIESGNIEKDEAYKVQFKKVGIFAFHDHYNPDVYIRVIVDNK